MIELVMWSLNGWIMHVIERQLKLSSIDKMSS